MTDAETMDEHYEMYSKCFICCAYVTPLNHAEWAERFRRCDQCWNAKPVGFNQHLPIPVEEWRRNDE